MPARKATALLAAVLLCAAGAADARHCSSGGEPGEFAYYVLSLSWSPAFCLSSPGAPECAGPRPYGFIVHGLWPQYEQGWPERCGGDSRVPEDVALGISDLMPARQLIYHEWSTHGTCSGLAPGDFFGLLRRAFASVAVPPELSKPMQATEQSPAAIAGAFRRANPLLAAQSIVVTCTGQDAPRLREIRICLTRDLGSRACSASALRGGCRAPQVIIPPVR